MINKERVLKIVPRYFARRWQGAVFPEIRLAGKWLHDLGFKCGRHVTISQQDNTITITILPEAETKPTAQKLKRKVGPQLPPELEQASGYELLNTFGEEYLKHIEAVKQWKRDKKEKNHKRMIEREATGFKSDKDQIVQLHPEPAKVAPPDDQIIRLHPEPRQAADGTDYFTIA